MVWSWFLDVRKGVLSSRAYVWRSISLERILHTSLSAFPESWEGIECVTNICIAPSLNPYVRAKQLSLLKYILILLRTQSHGITIGQ